eukprot:6185802-Pleurochrysis_carterae.AAC.5
MRHWERYVTALGSSHGCSPAVYDLFCAEGAFNRKAVLAGAQVIGFDIQESPRTFGMLAISLLGRGKLERALIPEMLHPGKRHSKPRFLSSDLLGPEAESYIELLQATIRRLQSYQRERLRLDYVPVPWSVEKTQEAKPIFDEFGYPQIQLCDTMFRHQVFHHRLFMCSNEASMALSCNHEGKHLRSCGHAHVQIKERRTCTVFAAGTDRLAGDRMSYIGQWVLTLVASRTVV